MKVPFVRWAVALVVTAMVMGILAQFTTAAPLQQAATGSWSKLPGTIAQSAFHVGSAYDTKNNQLIIFGGLSSDNSTRNSVTMIKVSDPDPNKATITGGAGGGQKRYGTAGAYWPPKEGDANDQGKGIFIGGADDAGTGDSGIQILDVKTGAITNMTPGGSQQRVFASAAYDPGHGVIFVVGGTKNCKLIGRPTPTPKPTMAPDSKNAPEQSLTCTADRLAGQILKPDANGVWAFETGPTGGPTQLLGGAMAYDAMGKRMFFFGGTTAEDQNPSKVLWVLNLTDPDVKKATWSQMSVSGGPSARAFHGMAFDANKNMLIVGSGIAKDFFATSENVSTDTWALDFSGASPTWRNLTTSPGERAAGAMEYSPTLKRVVFAAGRKTVKAIGSQNVNNDALSLSISAPTPVPPTATRPGTAVPGTPGTPGATKVPTGVPTVAAGKVCTVVNGRVPPAVINAKLAAFKPDKGCNSSLPIGFNNPARSWLSLQDPGKPWHPLFNDLVFKCSCP